MMPLTPASFVGTASSFIGLREEGGANRGLMIDLFLHEVGLTAGQPWCAAFVHHAGYWSHYDFAAGRSSWPLPATASCHTLGVFARAKGILREEPRAGDVFLLWSPSLARFAHTGVIANVQKIGTMPGVYPWSICDTVEGNTNVDGGREGTSVRRRIRRFDRLDRFIRWADLESRDTTRDPVNPARPANPEYTRVA